MIKCPHCRGANGENAKFCRHCGSPLYDSDYSSTKLPLGTELDNRYKIIDYIAKGGMGAVYKAVDMKISGVWAVKEMLDYFDSEGERDYAVERFATEAQILYDLNHSSIPRFVDCFVADNRYYLIMEHIDGVDLRAMLEEAMKDGKQGLEEDDVTRWAIQICNVLYYLHTQNPPIIYRDMKPGNIMVTDDGRVYLIDFGIARLFDPRTKGTMVGTQGYAPPEQYRGEAEPKSDIYSLAACMHHILTGKDPRNDIPFNFPPVRTIRPDLSPKIEKILEKALAMEPSERFETAMKMSEALKAVEFTGDMIFKEVPIPEYAPPKTEELPKIREIIRKQDETPVEGHLTKTMTGEDVAKYDAGAGKLSFWYMYRSDKRHSGRSPFGRNIYGNLRWSFDTGAPVRSSPSLGAKGEIYVGSYNGILYCIAPSGKEVWRHNTKSRILSSPTLDLEGNIYVGSNDCYIHALDPYGSVLWRFKTYGRIRSSPCVGLDGTIYIGSYDHYLYAINPDGTLKWRIDLGGHLESTPAISDSGNIYVACRAPFKTQSYLYCLDTGGNIIWYQELEGPSFSSACIARNGDIYIGADDGILYALYGNGSLRWKFRTEGPIKSSPVSDDGKSLYFGSFDRNLYAVTTTGQVMWKFMAKSSITSSPAISGNGMIFFGCDDFYIYSLTPGGKLNWKYKCKDRVRSSPAIGEGDVLYVGSDDGFIYALE